MKLKNRITICFIILFIPILALIGSAWADTHEDNIAWKEAQMQEKFNNINMSDYTNDEEQMAKVQRTIDYLKYWGWRGHR